MNSPYFCVHLGVGQGVDPVHLQGVAAGLRGLVDQALGVFDSRGILVISFG